MSQALDSSCCSIVEVRQYTLSPGSFEEFIAHFERYFVEGQEADGTTVIGSFRVLDDPNRFFWIRGFGNMEARKSALTAFYDGPLWKAHREVANSMLVENDNVLLLHPAPSGPALSIDTSARPPIGSKTTPPGLMVATIYSLGPVDPMKFDEFFQHSMRPAIIKSGARLAGVLATERAANNFPRLPIREDPNVYVWFSCFEDEVDYDRYRNSLVRDRQWSRIRETLALWHMYSPPETWRLQATPRSALHC